MTREEVREMIYKVPSNKLSLAIDLMKQLKSYRMRDDWSLYKDDQLCDRLAELGITGLR